MNHLEIKELISKLELEANNWIKDRRWAIEWNPKGWAKIGPMVNGAMSVKAEGLTVVSAVADAKKKGA